MLTRLSLWTSQLCSKGGIKLIRSSRPPTQTSSSAQWGLTSSSSSPQAMQMLTPEALQDLDDLLNDNKFYYSLATLLCTGKFGRQSEYMRNLNAPERSMGTRSTSVDTPRPPSVVLHAKRAFDRYVLLTQFVPFSEQKPNMFRATVLRLAILAVKYAIRAHYLGIKFSEDDDDNVLPHRNAIDYFFERNHKTGMFELVRGGI
ncbi:hypothetical protein BGZ65_009018, partial [Modicella reniformis]